VHVRVIADNGLPVDRFGFERVCLRAATGCTVRVQYTAAGDLPNAVRDARRSGEAVLLCSDAQTSSDDLRTAVVEAAPTPLVWLDLNAPFEPRQHFQDPARVMTIRGRGLEGIAWGVRSLVARSEVPPTVNRYGDDIEQVGDLRLPLDAEPPWPVIVLIHGGGWRERWERDLMDGIASDLTRRGYATWNLEFRRVGASGGGWPVTFTDVAAGIDHLRELQREAPIDLERVVALGHSAGGHLAVWAASRPQRRQGSPGAEPVVPVSAAVGLAGVYDLVSSAERGMDELSTVAMMGGLPSERPDVYALASPSALVPIGVDQLLIVGVNDRPDLVDDNRRYVENARAAGDDVDLMELPDTDHFTVIDPSTLSWFAIAERLSARFPPALPAREPEPAAPVSRT
jgi:acetyl esterase/lipase